MPTEPPILSNFIDGEPVACEGDRTDPQPRHRRGARAGVSLDRRGRRARGRGRAQGVRDVVGNDARPALAGAARAGRPDRGARRGDRPAGGARRGQADRGGEQRRDPGDGRQPALLRRRRALPGGPGRGRVHGGLHLVHAPRGGRGDRTGDAVELPADDGDLEIRSGARGRQHGRAQARGDDADDHPALRRAGGGDPAGGRAQRRDGTGRADGRGADRSPRRRHARR